MWCCSLQIYSELSDDIADRDKQWVAMSCYLIRHGADLYRANNKGERSIDLITDQALRTTLTSFMPDKHQRTAAPS